MSSINVGQLISNVDAVGSSSIIHLRGHVGKLVKRKGSDYFTENLQVKENKTRMRNIHPRFFHLLF